MDLKEHQDNYTQEGQPRDLSFLVQTTASCGFQNATQRQPKNEFKTTEAIIVFPGRD